MQTLILQQWHFGVIVRKLGTRHYVMKLNLGREIKRHVNQLRQSAVLQTSAIPNKMEKKVTFANVYQPLSFRAGPVQPPDKPIAEQGVSQEEPTLEEANESQHRRNPERNRKKPAWLSNFHCQ